MLGTVVLRALNLPALWRHARRGADDVWDPADDLELKLYRSIANVDYLHYGYFDPVPADPAAISLADLQGAMVRYAEMVAAYAAPGQRVLDVGCGTGGLLGCLAQAGAEPIGLTPNVAHATYVRERYPGVPVHQSRMEDLDLDGLRGTFDLVINSESLQYIELDAACRNVRALLKPGGRWLVADFFRLSESARIKAGHMLDKMEATIAKHGFSVAKRIDLTENVLPTLALAHSLASRVGLPLANFYTARFLAAHPVWNYLVGDLARGALGRIKLDGLDPAVFQRDKRYMLFELTVAA
jgi:MPBQ/MSBQ methyltransferase